MSIVSSIIAASIVIGAGPSDSITLEDLVEEGHFVRGFIADGSGCAMFEEPVISGNSVTLVLADYIAAKDGVGFDKATCDLAVEVELPPGNTVSFDSVTYRGFSDAFDASTTFYREYFFAGEFSGDRRFTVVDYDGYGVGTVLQDDSDDYISDFGEFTARDNTVSIAESPCGGVAVYRTNTALTVRNPLATSSSFAAIDTVDITNKRFITFDVVVESCVP